MTIDQRGNPGNCNSARRRAGVNRMKRHSLKTDMTPMVDLGFLLVTFFVFTSVLSRPHTTQLVMPREGNTRLGESNALTVLLGKEERLYYYHGDWETALESGSISPTSFSVNDGLGRVIRAKQAVLDSGPIHHEGRNGLMLIIKPGPDAVYGNVIDVLDEALINAVMKYIIVKPSTEENKFLSGPH